MTRTIGYVTDSRRTNRWGWDLCLDAQIRRLEREAAAQNWSLELLIDKSEIETADFVDRDAFNAVLKSLDRGDFDVLAIASLSLLTTDRAKFAELMERANKKGWRFVALDIGVDTSTWAGALMANVLISAAQYEREIKCAQ